MATPGAPRTQGIDMHFAKEGFYSEHLVRAYSDGEVTVGARSYRRSIILSADRLVDDWRPQEHHELTAEDLEPVVAMQPEIVLLGTGRALRFPAPRLTVGLLQAGIGVEVMDTAAACRTFNILLAEDRNVVAALLLR
ncbi:MAG: Mth938-like domain-containing protein [Thiogranum sp.]|nr:Mth938-like domain-containing protein [Thiogranum sp.]